MAQSITVRSVKEYTYALEQAIQPFAVPFSCVEGQEVCRFQVDERAEGEAGQLEQISSSMRLRVDATEELYGDVLCSRHSVVSPDSCTVLDNEGSHHTYCRTVQFVTSTHIVSCINRGIHQSAFTVPIGKMHSS